MRRLGTFGNVMDFAASIVMNDYLGPLELRACRGVSRSWRVLSGNAIRLPRVRERAARTIQRAWRKSPKKVRKEYSEEIASNANRAFGVDWDVLDYLRFTRTPQVDGGVALVGYGRHTYEVLDFYNTGISIEISSRDRVVPLEPRGAVATNIRAKGRSPRVSFEQADFVLDDILEHPDAVIPTGLLWGGGARLILSEDTESVSYTLFFPPGNPRATDGPLNGVAGVAVRSGRLVADVLPRALVSKRSILGRWWTKDFERRPWREWYDALRRDEEDSSDEEYSSGGEY